MVVWWWRMFSWVESSGRCPTAALGAVAVCSLQFAVVVVVVVAASKQHCDWPLCLRLLAHQLFILIHLFIFALAQPLLLFSSLLVSRSASYATRHLNNRHVI